MDSYIIIITLIGVAALGMAWMPLITRITHISYTIFYVLLGALAYRLIPDLPDPMPQNNPEYALHLSEIIVVVSLMGSGLKIDQPFSIKGWAVPFRLILITMVLTMGMVTLAGYAVLGFTVAGALLLGAALAPTDPVLAADVQVGPPNEGVKDNTRFSLTAEAGMNDGMAFPFVYLALSLVMIPESGLPELGWHWFLFDLLYRIAAGAGVGFLTGRLLGWAVFKLPEKKDYMKTRDGFVAVAATLLVYGITEMIHGYGFIAVFVTAVTMRNFERQHTYHRKLHAFTDQIERILLAVILILFGGALASGILDRLTWTLGLFALAFVFLIRPACAYLALLGTPLHRKERLVISFFGIRGVGSVFYLAFAFDSAQFREQDTFWSVAAFIILVSVVLHGSTAVLAMRKIREEFSEEVEIREKE
ncbi:MAG TPA: cation:proton antiporter [Sphingobacteriaceae bacterium]